LHEVQELKVIMEKNSLGTKITGGQGRIANGPNPLKNETLQPPEEF